MSAQSSTVVHVASMPLTPVMLVAFATGVAAARDEPHAVVCSSCRRIATRDPRDESIAADDVSSVAFVNDMGSRAFYHHDAKRSAWPLPRLFRSADFAAAGDRARALYRTPVEGDLALAWNPARRTFDHTSIVVRIVGAGAMDESIRCRVVDSATRGTKLRIATFTPARGDRFFRWAELNAAALRDGAA